MAWSSEALDVALAQAVGGKAAPLVALGVGKDAHAVAGVRRGEALGLLRESDVELAFARPVAGPAGDGDAVAALAARRDGGGPAGIGLRGKGCSAGYHGGIQRGY